MIDTVKFLINTTKIDPKLIKEFKGDINSGEIRQYEGKLKNMILKVYELNNLSTLTGSLPKFRKGNNLNYLDYDSIKDTIKELSDYLNCDLRKAKVRRIDLGVNIENLNHGYEMYFSSLGNFPKMKRTLVVDGETLRFKSQNRVIQLYDKTKELKHINKNIQRILRFELQIFRIKKILGSEVFGSDILSQTFLSKLRDELSDTYHKIKKYDLPALALEGIKDKKTTLMQFASIGIKSVGFENALLQLCQKQQCFSSTTFYKTKELLWQLYNHSRTIETTSLIEELNQKFEEGMQKNNSLLNILNK